MQQEEGKSFRFVFVVALCLYYPFAEKRRTSFCGLTTAQLISYECEHWVKSCWLLTGNSAPAFFLGGCAYYLSFAQVLTKSQQKILGGGLEPFFVDGTNWSTVLKNLAAQGVSIVRAELTRSMSDERKKRHGGGEVLSH